MPHDTRVQFIRNESILNEFIGFSFQNETLILDDLLYLYNVRIHFLTLVVQLTVSFILSFITQVITTGTSSDLSRKVWVTAYKGDTY